MSRARMSITDVAPCLARPACRATATATTATAATGGGLTPAGSVLLDLQRTRGNHYVQRVIQASSATAAGRPGDRYEREADRVAQDIVRNGRAGAVRVRGGGAIPEQVRAPLEQAMGTDFSRVRVHVDDRADRYSRELQATAFTSGQDIYFRRGAYDTQSTAGQQVLAHELTHVVQQRAAGTPAIQCRNQLTTTDTDRQEQPISVLHQAFQADFNALGITENYVVYGKVFDPASIDAIFTDGVADWRRPNRPKFVRATLDGKRPGGPRASDAPQGLYGYLGVVERAMFGRPALGAVYEGGHFVSDEILGSDSYTEFNFAPQDKKLNSPLWRNFEEMADRGPLDPITGTRAPSWTYEINVRYPADYTLSAQELSDVGVIPPAVAARNPAKAVTFPRRVPDLWEGKLDAPMGYTFSQEELKSTTHAYNYYTSTATHIVGQSAVVRQGSGGLNMGMNSLEEQITGAGTERFIGGNQAEHFAALQYYPQTIAQQPVRAGAGLGGVAVAALVPTARPPLLAQPTSLQKAIEKPASKHRARIIAAYPKLAAYIWAKALPWAWKQLKGASLPTALQVLKKAMAWKGKGASKLKVTDAQKKVLMALARDSNLTF